MALFKLGLKIFFLLPAFGLAARADLNLGHTEKWTLAQVLNMVEENNPSLIRANSKINEMRDSKDLAIAGYFPYLGLQSTISSNEFVLNQKIYDGGASLAAIDIAQNRGKIAEIEKDLQKEKIRTQVTEAYYEAIFASQKRAFLESNSKVVSTALEKATKQFKFRAIGHDAMLRAQVQFRKNRSEMFEAQNAERAATRVLAHLTRIPGFSAEWLADSLNPNTLPKPIKANTPADGERILASLPEVEILRASEKALNAEKEFDLSADRPNISFAASYGLGQQAPAFSVNYVYAVGFQYGFSLTIPFFSGFSSYARKKVFSERRYQIEQDVKNLSSDFDFEYKEKIDLLNQDWKDLQSIKEELKASEDIWREADVNFRIGLSSPDVWFEATDNVRQWKIRQLEKARDYFIQYQYVSKLSPTRSALER